jgi:succinate dehydrogenase/fumarate reductase flavoprotein subunit
LRATRGDDDIVLRAHGGVVLASGGFEWNEQLKRQFLPGPVTHPNSPPANEGDGLIMAAEAGAALGTMTEIWGSPAAAIPGEEYDGRPLSRLVVPERMCPHTILVNRTGRRFVNEGAPYNDLGKVFNEFDTGLYGYRNVPCWAIFDRQYRERYPVLTVLPGTPNPDWLPRAGTLEQLATSEGIDVDGLAATIERWNNAARLGRDDEFGRHGSPIDLEAPHPSMGTIEQPPFYALPVHPGTLGTKGGPVTNAEGRVVDVRGDVIPGLFAAGNVMAGISGPGYFGGGATIGLAMTWGYICGINAAQAAIARG